MILYHLKRPQTSNTFTHAQWIATAAHGTAQAHFFGLIQTAPQTMQPNGF
jgi:hypothetical protein